MLPRRETTMDEHKVKKLTFDRREAAERLGISVVTLDRQLARRRIPHFRVGRRVLFTDELLQQFITQNTEGAVTQQRRSLRR
ncbi:MAG: excisionase family DNA-binding protein [Pyrinomonadaceae bacterium]